MKNIGHGTEWVDEHKRILIVEECLNLHEDAPLPAIVVYRDWQQNRHAEFVETFRNRTTLRGLIAGDAELELLKPKFAVTFNEDRVPPDAMLVYFFDAVHEMEPERAETIARYVIERMLNNYGKQTVALAGEYTRPVLSQVEFRFNSRKDRNDGKPSGPVNYVGRVGGSPVIWGNNIANGAPLAPWIAFASVLRHAFRRVVAIQNIPANDTLRRLYEAYQAAYTTLIPMLKLSKMCLPFISHRDGLLTISVPDTLFADERYGKITIGVDPTEAGKWVIDWSEDNGTRQILTSLFDFEKVIGGLA